MAMIAGVNLSKEAQKKLVKAAISAAVDNGYCAETRTVLADMGFDLPDEKLELTITVKVKVPFGVDEDEVKRNLDVLYQGYEDEVYVDDFEVH